MSGGLCWLKPFKSGAWTEFKRSGSGFTQQSNPGKDFL